VELRKENDEVTPSSAAVKLIERAVDQSPQRSASARSCLQRNRRGRKAFRGPPGVPGAQLRQGERRAIVATRPWDRGRHPEPTRTECMPSGNYRLERTMKQASRVQS